MDIGGESTRPGSDYVSTREELARVIPVVKVLRDRHPEIPISVDTRKSEVAKQAIECGARYINDVSALRDDPEIARLLADHPQVKVILMHMHGDPKSMQNDPQYDDLIPEILSFFQLRVAYCLAQGISRDRILIDPGIGFGKTLQHNICLLSHLDAFHTLGLPIVLGASRKRFISAIYPSEANARIGGTLATAWIASLQKVDILRVHDVMDHAQFFVVLKALAEGR